MDNFQPVLTAGIGLADLTQLANYEAIGGYAALRKALKEMEPAQVTDTVLRSGLRGRGGAGFPAGRKWSFLPNDGRERFLCCNADEGEPGTFKDRLLIERKPHLLLEGMALASYALGIRRAFIYIRGEMELGASILERAVSDASTAGYLGEHILGSGFSLQIVVHRGAGAYICGEETALIESLEGKRGNPRLRPPFPAIAGVYAGPTVVNNVETLANVPAIIDRGAEWFAAIGPAKSPGPKIFPVSGCVQRPGNYELPMGTTLREIIFGMAGGMREGRKFKGVLPGGSSTPVLVEQQLDTPMDYESVAAAGSMFGSGAIIVLDDSVCIVKTAARLARFYAHESCGKCTPCREGTPWLAAILDRIEAGVGEPGDLELLEDIARGISGNTFCPLGEAALGFLDSSLKAFRQEYLQHIEGKRCPQGANAA